MAEIVERTVRKSDGAFIQTTKDQDGKTITREFYDDIPNEEKKQPSRDVEISTTIDTHPGCMPVNIDRQRAEAAYQNQFVGLGQKPSQVVQAIQPQRERPQPASVNRCVPSSPCAPPPQPPSGYSQQQPRAIADTRRQEVNAHRRNSRPQQAPSLPRLSMPRTGRGRGKR